MNMPTVVELKITINPELSPTVAKAELLYQLSELGLTLDDVDWLENKFANMYLIRLK